MTVILRIPRIYSVPTLSNLLHNSGLKKADYWLEKDSEIFMKPDIRTIELAEMMFNQWIEEAKTRYAKNPIKSNKIRKDAVIIEELLIIVGRDVKINKNQIIEVFYEFRTLFESYFQTRVLHFAVHDHEGHESVENIKIYNYHVHVLFDNVDKNGEMIRRRMKRKDLKYMQDMIFVASKKVLGEYQIERATNYEEIGEKAPNHISHVDYRIKAENNKLLEQNKELYYRLKKLQAKLYDIENNENDDRRNFDDVYDQ